MNYVRQVTVSFLLTCCAQLMGAHEQQDTINIIFDLGGVLFDVNKIAVFKEIGFFNAASLMLWRSSLMNALEQIPPFTQTDIVAYDDHEQKLAPIFCDWLKGIPSTLLLDRIHEYLSHDKICLELATIIFTPERFTPLQYLIPEGAKLVEDCHNKGYHLYILSNWSAESFEILYKDYKEFFDLFDGIVISGSCGLIKPDPAIFNHLVAQHNIDPEQSVFIDDQKVNIEAAQQCGIAGIHCPKTGIIFHTPAIETVRKQLTTWIATRELNENEISTIKTEEVA